MTKDYDYRLKKKDDEIQELKRKIEEMSAEFAKMLKVIDSYSNNFLNLPSNYIIIGHFGQDARENRISIVGFRFRSSDDETFERYDWTH